MRSDKSVVVLDPVIISIKKIPPDNIASNSFISKWGTNFTSEWTHPSPTDIFGAFIGAGSTVLGRLAVMGMSKGAAKSAVQDAYYAVDIPHNSSAIALSSVIAYQKEGFIGFQKELAGGLAGYGAGIIMIALLPEELTIAAALSVTAVVGYTASKLTTSFLDTLSKEYTSINDAGVKVTVYSDGFKKEEFPDGKIALSSPDSTTTYNADGSYAVVENGITHHFNADDRLIESQLQNGLQIHYDTNRGATINTPDGRKVTVNVTDNSDGSQTFSTTQNGVTTATTVSEVASDHITVNTSDGAITKFGFNTNLDGSSSFLIRNSDGTITEKNISRDTNIVVTVVKDETGVAVLSNEIETKNADGSLITFVHYADGRDVTTTVSNDGSVSHTFERSSDGKITEATVTKSEDGSITISTINPDGITTKVEVSEEGKKIESITRDSDGNIINQSQSVKDSDGSWVSSFHYTNGTYGEITESYDSSGNIKSVNKLTNFEDGSTSETISFANGRVERTNRDENGGITSFSTTQIFEEDGSSIETVSYADGHTVKLTYDGDGKLLHQDAVETGSNNLSYAAGATASFLSLVKAIQAGQPLPIVTSGASTLVALQNATTNGHADTVLSGTSSALSAVASLYSLQKNIENGDVIGSIAASAQTISLGATAYANMLGYSASTEVINGITIPHSAIENAVTNGAIDTGVGETLQGIGSTISYLNLVNDLAHGNTVGIAIDALSIAFPPAAPFLMIGSLIFGGLFGDDDPPTPWGNGQFIWSPDGTLGIRVSGDHGGDNTVLLTLQNYQSSLENIVDKFQEQNSDTTIGLVVNRLASLSMDGQNFTLRDIDPVTGADRSIHYDSSGKPTDAIPGSPEYFRSMGEQFIYSALGREAIAPQWEVETARLQTLAGDPQAGLTELQRAERNSKLAPAQDNAATSETWRPILLDLNGDGVQTTNQADANVAFDVDGTGYLKNTDWISQQDGFLVLDRNFNNSIDNGDELFSNSLVANSAKGLASMKWVDANADGDITTSDPVFNQLKVWQDINSNGAVDNGETKTLNALGITALHYGRGSYEKDGQTNQMNSPDLTADTVGAQVHTVKGGIVVQNDNGQVSFIVTNTEDFSGIEDTPVDILANDLLKSTAFTIVGVSDARHGSVSLHNGVVHFVPEENYFGADAGFSYTKQDANGNAAAVQFDMQFEARNDIPVVSDIGNYKTPIYGYRVSSSGSDGGADTLEPFFSPGYGYDKSGSNYEYRNEAIDNIIDPYHGNLKITDPDDTVFSYKMLHNGLHGNAVINSDGSWSFTPTDHVGGHDVFQLEVDDEHGGSAIKSISVPIPDPLPENGSSEGGEGADGSETEAEAEAESAEAEAEAEGAEAEGAEAEGAEAEGAEAEGAEAEGAEAEGAEAEGAEAEGAEAEGAEAEGAEAEGAEGEGGGGGEGGEGGGGEGGGGEGGDPIVLDLDRNGFTLISAQESKAFYDIKDDGWRYKMGWVTGGDGLLAYDANSDGKIAGRNELSFKDYLAGAQTDLQGLSAFDSNHDNKLSALDSLWDKLVVWRDANGDGVSEDGEIKTLTGVGIKEISLTSNNQFSTQNGNTIHGEALVSMIDGTQMQAADVTFQVSDRALLSRAGNADEIFTRMATSAPTEILGSDNNDTLVGTTGSNHITGGKGDDFLFDDQGNDVIEGGDGKDVIYSGADNDVVAGGGGDDTVFAGKGNDIIVGDVGEDALLGEDGNDIEFGGDGNDLLDGGNGNDVLSGDQGDDTVYGGTGADALFGGDGNDLLSGGDGNDRIQGDAGDDILNGGSGVDTLVYSGSFASYSISKVASGFNISGPDGSDTISGFERYQFADKSFAFDFGTGDDTNNTVRIIGAALGAPEIQQHPDYVGIGLNLFDSGQSMLDVSQLAIEAMNNPDNQTFVNTVYQNIMGTAPSQEELNYYVGMLVGSGGSYSQTALLALAANSDQNSISINLVGLQLNGVEFI